MGSSRNHFSYLFIQLPLPHSWNSSCLWPHFFCVAQVVKNPPASAEEIRDTGSIPGSRKPPGLGNGNPLQYSCLENPINRGAWQATVHRITKSRTWLSNWEGKPTADSKVIGSMERLHRHWMTTLWVKTPWKCFRNISQRNYNRMVISSGYGYIAVI